MPSPTIVIAMNVKTCSEWRSMKVLFYSKITFLVEKKCIICFALIDVSKQKNVKQAITFDYIKIETFLSITIFITLKNV